MHYTVVVSVVLFLGLFSNGDALNNCRKRLYVGENCTTTSECLDGGLYTHCDLSSNTCECNDGYISRDDYYCIWKSTCSGTCNEDQFCNVDLETCEPKKKFLGDSCNGHGQCAMKDSFCNESQKCNCLLPFKPNENKTECVLCSGPQICNSTTDCSTDTYCDPFLSICRKKLNVEKRCSSDDQCSLNSFCCMDLSVNLGRCKCNSGYDSIDGSTCVNSTSPNTKASICEPWYKEYTCPEPCPEGWYCEYDGWVNFYCTPKTTVGEKCRGDGIRCFTENAHCNDARNCVCDDFYEMSVNKTCDYNPTKCSEGCPEETHYCDDAKGLCRKKRFLGGSCTDNSQCFVDRSECTFKSHNEVNCDMVGVCECPIFPQAGEDYATCFVSPLCFADADCYPQLGQDYYCDKSENTSP